MLLVSKIFLVSNAPRAGKQPAWSTGRDMGRSLGRLGYATSMPSLAKLLLLNSGGDITFSCFSCSFDFDLLGLQISDVLLGYGA